MKRKIAILASLFALVTIAVAALSARRAGDAPEVTAAAVTRGSIVSSVSATGTLDATTSVQVGSQVSGTIEQLLVDYNSIVKKGQVLARLDQSLFLSAIEQARANVVKAQADVDRLRVTEADAALKLDRARLLAAKQLIPETDLQNAEVTLQLAQAQVRSSDAQVTLARASLQQAQVNFNKTVITAPIDGIVISRSVDVGQTVAASLSAPTIFVIAADLSHMQLSASIDESDLGRIKEGQAVTFTVDAYPSDTFHGEVRQVRLSPVVASNVVTYTAVIDAPNPDLKLKPGMTATVNVEIVRRDNVLRAPVSALRFKPSADVLKAIGAAAPPVAKDRRGTLTEWQYPGTTATPVPVKLGASDGAWTELVDAPFSEGTRLVTRVTTAAAAASAPAAATRTTSPLMGAQPQGPRGR
jgi:HlyD family secretion protein